MAALTAMRTLGLLAGALAIFAAGCAVSTQVVQLDPARKFAPTENVEVLLEKPTRPYTQIALLESRGDGAGGEAALLNDAREKARTLGADAIVRLEVERVYHPPVAVYDPWYDPFYWHGYRSRYRALPPFPGTWGGYRVVGGGYSYTLKTLAIKYQPIEKS